MMAILKEKAALAYLKNAEEMLSHRNSEFTPLKLLVVLLEIERSYQQLLANTNANYQLMVQIERHGFPNLSAWFVDIKNALRAFDDIKLSRTKSAKRILTAVFSEMNAGAEIENHLLDDEAFLRTVMKLSAEDLEYLRKANFGITDGIGKKVLIAAHQGKTPFQDGWTERTSLRRNSGLSRSYSDSSDVSPASTFSIKLLTDLALIWFISSESGDEISETPLPISSDVFFDSNLFKVSDVSATRISLVNKYDTERLSSAERKLWDTATLLKPRFALEALLTLDFVVLTEENRNLFFTTLRQLNEQVERFDTRLKQFLNVASVDQLGTIIVDELMAIRAKILEFEWPEVRSVLMVEVFKHFQALLPPDALASTSGKSAAEQVELTSSVVPPPPAFFSMSNFKRMSASWRRKP